MGKKEDALAGLLDIIQSNGDKKSGDGDDSIKGIALETLALSYNHSHKFMPGQKVRWKKGMKHERYPKLDQEAVVVEMLDAPVKMTGPELNGTAHFNEVQDIRIGMINGDTFHIYHFDSRRFEPVIEKKH